MSLLPPLLVLRLGRNTTQYAQLCLEESLFRKTGDNWCIIRDATSEPTLLNGRRFDTVDWFVDDDLTPQVQQTTTSIAAKENGNPIVVLGISGKVDELVNVRKWLSIITPKQ